MRALKHFQTMDFGTTAPCRGGTPTLGRISSRFFTAGRPSRPIMFQVNTVAFPDRWWRTKMVHHLFHIHTVGAWHNANASGFRDRFISRSSTIGSFYYASAQQSAPALSRAQTPDAAARKLPAPSSLSCIPRAHARAPPVFVEILQFPHVG